MTTEINERKTESETPTVPVVTGINTDKGVAQIDYNALANLPNIDTTLTEFGAIAEAAAVGEAIDELTAAIESLGGDIGDIGGKGYITNADLKDYLEKNNYVNASQVATKEKTGVVKIGSGLVVTTDGTVSVNTGSEDNKDGYITENMLESYLDENHYINSLPISTASTPGIVSAGAGLSVTTSGVLSVSTAAANSLGAVKIGNGINCETDGTISIGKLDELSNVDIVPSIEIAEVLIDSAIEDYWFLIKAEE